MLDYIQPALIPLGVFLLLCAIIGIIGNLIMILCTVKMKKFQSPCHILICLNCFVDGLQISGQFPYSYFLFGNRIIGYTTGGPLILTMGIDRFIAVKFPATYRYYQNQSINYLLIQLIFPIIYCFSFLIFGYLMRDDKILMTCSNPLALHGISFQIYTYTSAVIYITVFIIYLKVFILLKSNKTSKIFEFPKKIVLLILIFSDNRFKKVFRSISVTVGFVLFGWVITTGANTLSYSITDNEETTMIIQVYAGITVNLAAASNVFVFYAINSEYREVIRSLLFFKKSAATLGLEKTSSTAAPPPINSGSRSSLAAKSARTNLDATNRRMTLI